MDRKKFLLTSSLAVLGLSTYGSVVKFPNGKFNGDCETTNDILGPFYRPDAPLRSDLTYEGIEGSLIELNGIVYGSDCITPLKEAMIEIWQCNAKGEYDNDSNQYHLRGRLITDASGKYAFTTIIPGKYMNGKLYRPSHIHFRITEKNSKELISQVYFKGDPQIAQDPWASKPQAELRTLEIIPQNTSGNLRVNFDIYLKGK